MLIITEENKPIENREKCLIKNNYNIKNWGKMIKTQITNISNEKEIITLNTIETKMILDIFKTL